MRFNARWLERLVPGKAGRPRQLKAYYWRHASLRSDPVRDGAGDGFYLITREPWPLGAVVSVTLQQEGPLRKDRRQRMTRRATVSRLGDDGVELTFLPASDAEGQLWDDLVEGVLEHYQLGEMADLVRMADALKFLSRISSGGAMEFARLLSGRLSRPRLARAIEIALRAQDLLALEPARVTLRASPQLAVRILEEGSSAGELWLREYWGGLLAASCSPDGRDNTSLASVELLSRLGITPLRILVLVCRAARHLSGSGPAAGQPVLCRIDEMAAITGGKEAAIEREIESLSRLGLIEVEQGEMPAPGSGGVKITPTRAAMELFARCNGQREAPAVNLPRLTRGSYPA